MSGWNAVGTDYPSLVITVGECESKICLRCTAYTNTTSPLKVKIYRKSVIEASVYLLAA